MVLTWSWFLPERVLEAVVRGSREHQVGSSQLLDVAQSLELRRVDDGHQQGVEFQVAVDGVVEHLSPTRRGRGHCWKWTDGGTEGGKTSSSSCAEDEGPRRRLIVV